MLAIVCSIALALAIGAACRHFDVPLPAPPSLYGAALVMAMTLGYVLTDAWLG